MAPAEHLDAVQEALIRAARQGADRRSRARRACRWARSPAASSCNRCARRSPSSPKSARIVAGDPDRSPVDGNGAFIAPILLRSDDPWGAAGDPRRRGVRAGLDDHALSRPRRRDRARQSRHGLAGLVAVHLRSRRRRGFRARRRRLSRPDGDPRPDLAPRNRPATARPSPSSSMAAPAAPAAARRWAGSAASPITCSAPRSRARPDMLPRWSGNGCRAPTKTEGDVHPFRKRISELEIGYTLKTASRTVTLEDIEHFAAFHRRQFLRPHGRGGGEGEPDLRRPRRPRLSDPLLRRRPVRRSRSRARCSPITASRACAS